MPRPGFRRNAKTVSKILKTHDGGKRAIVQRIFDQLPDDVKAQSRIVTYITDREVVAIEVPADLQAKDGVVTKAASAAGIRTARR